MPHGDGIFEFMHARKKHVVKNQQYARCNSCGVEGYLEGQRDHNKTSIDEFQAKLPDYISPSRVLALREKYELTQELANKLFGGGKHGFSKWERGVVEPAGPTARLMKVALESESTLLELAKVAGVELDFFIKKAKKLAASRAVIVSSHILHVDGHYRAKIGEGGKSSPAKKLDYLPLDITESNIEWSPQSQMMEPSYSYLN